VRRILIIDRHEIVREGLKRILDDQAGPKVIGEAGAAPDALRLVRERDWDMAVLDFSLGGRGGLEVLKELRRIRSKMPVLILSMHTEEDYARRAFKAGAAGYITKDSPRGEFARAIDKVLGGGRYVSAALAETLSADLARGTDRPPHEILSDREFEVLRWIGLGKTVREIATLLTLSDKTVSTYRARLLEKMDLKTSAQLICYAIRNQLVDPLGDEQALSSAAKSRDR
jgi:two-component system, NarL family, invasion response regulator UvrY